MALLYKMLKWLVGLCTIGTLCILLGCEADVKEECGGIGDLVSCLSIDSIDPTDSISGNETSNVDALPSTCPPDGVPEPFGDHSAAITFSNRQFPAATGDTEPTVGGSLLITIVNYSVSYTLNHCPERATGCPALTGFTVSPGQTFTIEPNGQRTVEGFPFVPLRVKEEYIAEGGHTGSSSFGFPFPSYTAHYVFTARTDFLSSDIEIEGFAEFTIGSFNNCSDN